MSKSLRTKLFGLKTDLFLSIQKMKEKLAAQRKHLDEVESHLNDMERAAKTAAQDQK